MTLTEMPLPEDEAQQAIAHWSAQKLRRTWTREQPRHGWLAEQVLTNEPRSVLEFGCATGRNLHAIRDRAPEVRLLGLDINPTAVRHGRNHWGLDLRVAGLDTLADDEVDVAFTVSVLDHIPDIEPTLEQLCRVAPLLLLVEPWLGGEGKVTDVTGTSPYSYSHDIAGRLRARGYAVRYEKHPLSDWGLGPWYRLYTARRRDGVTG